jgi:predicted RND superfamily exporter protein
MKMKIKDGNRGYQEFENEENFKLEQLMVEILVLTETETGKVVSSANLEKAYQLFEKMEQIAEIENTSDAEDKVLKTDTYLEEKKRNNDNAWALGLGEVVEQENEKKEGAIKMEVIDYAKKVFSTRAFSEERAYTVETLINDILDDYGVDPDQEIDCISTLKHNLKASRELEEINDIFKEIVTVAPELG